MPFGSITYLNRTVREGGAKEMPRNSQRITAARPSGGERVFTDDEGRLWSAAFEERHDADAALVFRCISDGRQSVRAMSVDPDALADAVDEALRLWLHHAPRIGILS